MGNNETKLKPKWWCIRKECNHYKQLHCCHSTIPNKKIRVKNLKMCPVLASIEVCLGII